MIIDAQELPGHGQTVCVTGARGFIASWLVKLLLERGYTVKGTVRNTEDPKNNHLKAMEGAADRLILCNADLSDFDAPRTAIHGCNGVFHTASPVTDDPELMVEPAVRGTKYVIDAAAVAGVQRVVFTSSIGAVTIGAVIMALRGRYSFNLQINRRIFRVRHEEPSKRRFYGSTERSTKKWH